MIDKEVISLLRLLEDNDAVVSGIVSQKLLEKGVDAIPDLEKAWEMNLNPTVQFKIEEIVHGIQFNQLKDDFRQWISKDAEDILYGAFLVAKYQYPDLQFSNITAEVEIIRRSAWVEFHENLTALEKIRIINHIFLQFINLSEIQQIFIPLVILISTRYWKQKREIQLLFLCFMLQ
jgi:hypothetical protein